MAYQIDEKGDIVINGWENGIADDPYAGISDIRNINLISIPKEASVNFSTAKNTYASPGTGNVTNSSDANDTITFDALATIEARMAITFSAISDATKGITTGTVYWLGNTGTTSSKLYTEASLSNLVNITADGLTGTFSFITMTGFPKYFTFDRRTGSNYCVDSTGRVWTNGGVTPTTNSWVYLGNTTLTNANGNGIIAYNTYTSPTANNTFLFVFRNGLIDYWNEGTGVWTYGWNPANGTTANTGTVLKTMAGVNNNHEAILAPDNKVYFTDNNWIGRFYQLTPTTVFDPTNTATYVWDQTSVLPSNDVANCMTVLGNDILIGGQSNIIYPWDTFSTLPKYPILLAEYNVQKMVTVNTNVYALVGNRGRVYITNGSQAQLYKKIPDHLSGTVEPYFTWGGLTSHKNQIYFSAQATTNAGTALTAYGGLWAIDVDTNAIRLVNRLSYGTYAGVATALLPNLNTTPSGTGLYIGWNSGVSTYGIDTTVSAPYSNAEAYIDTDLIPIGTFLQPTTNGRLEFKLATPLVAGETVQFYYRQRFSDSFTAVNNGEVDNGLWNTAGTYSGICRGLDFENSQWIQIRIALSSTSSTPSYTRLTEIRLGY